MGINYSSETSKTIIEEYEFRIQALLKKIDLKLSMLLVIWL